MRRFPRWRAPGQSSPSWLRLAQRLHVAEPLELGQYAISSQADNMQSTMTAMDGSIAVAGQGAPPIHAQVARYTSWLRDDVSWSSRPQAAEDRVRYQVAASQPIVVRGRRISPFAPFQARLSALRTLTDGQLCFAAFLAVALAVSVLLLGSTLFVGAMAVLTIFYLADLLLQVTLAVRTASLPSAQHIEPEIVHALRDVEWPLYTVLCPLYHESAVIPQFVRAMEAMDYPREKLQVLLLVEEDDKQTRDAISAQSVPRHFQIVTVPAGAPRTKPRACNYGLLQATGDYVVIYDAEDVPDPLQLKRSILTFADHGPEVACVQAKLNFYNARQNVLTRWFTAEYSLWFDLTLPGLQRAGFVLPLGGTSNHFRAEAIRAVGGWDTFNVTEDCDLGLRLAEYKFKTVMLDSTTYEEATSQPKNWLRQRSRWIKGYMQTYLVYMRRPTRYLHPRHWREFFSLQFIVGGKTAVLFINPIMWALVAVYILFRPFVIETYRTLFPTPVFYMAVFCLVFGNFFYVYAHLCGCFERRHFSMIKWTLFIPLYWVLTSAAAFIAAYQLIVKPHHWEKTHHGAHLRPVALGRTAAPSDAPLITFALAQRLAQPAELPAHHGHTRDRWLLATLLTACVVSITASWYFVSNDLQLVYGDSYAHMLIARRIVDNATPGLAQLGGIWLPLPHLLIAPFSWNDTLWQTGLAGTIPSMACFVVAAVYVFLLARRLTQNSRISYLGALVFILNPNVLYLQVTPLSEVVLIACVVMACHHFLAWVQDRSFTHLILAGATTVLATLARYDGWFLFVAMLVAIFVVGLMRRHEWSRIEAHALIFGIFGGLGIALWLLWCAVIFGDPLYFQHSQFSSETMQATLQQAHILYTYHNVGESTRYFTVDTLINVGPVIAVLGAVGLVLFFMRRRVVPETVAGLLCLFPFPFYVFSLYSGQAAMYLPQTVPSGAPYHLYNARYGAQLVAPAAIFIALLISVLVARFSSLRAKALVQGGVVAAIIAQSALTATGGIISLQDGQYGLDCATYHSSVIYLAQHYNGGRILEDLYTSKIDALESTASIHFKNIIYEGSGQYWQDALRDPASAVEWIIVNPRDPNDELVKRLPLSSPSFHKQFEVVVTEPAGLELLHRTGVAPLPTRTLSDTVLNEHRLCGPFGAGRTASSSGAPAPRQEIFVTPQQAQGPSATNTVSVSRPSASHGKFASTHRRVTHRRVTHRLTAGRTTARRRTSGTWRHRSHRRGRRR